MFLIGDAVKKKTIVAYLTSMHVIKKKKQKDYVAFPDNLKSKELNSKKLLLSKIYRNFFLKRDQMFLGFNYLGPA